MAKPISWSNDGVIFINFLKPVVKWIRLGVCRTYAVEEKGIMK